MRARQPRPVGAWRRARDRRVHAGARARGRATRRYARRTRTSSRYESWRGGVRDARADRRVGRHGDAAPPGPGGRGGRDRRGRADLPGVPDPVAATMRRRRASLEWVPARPARSAAWRPPSTTIHLIARELPLEHDRRQEQHRAGRPPVPHRRRPGRGQHRGADAGRPIPRAARGRVSRRSASTSPTSASIGR